LIEEGDTLSYIKQEANEKLAALKAWLQKDVAERTR